MKTHLRLQVSLLIVAISSIVGCASPKSFVDPTYGRATYADITRRAEPYKWRIVVECQRNGAHVPEVDGELMGDVERVVRASGIAIPSPEGSSGQLKVVVNDIAATESAGWKGFVTGLTFGLVGSTAIDYYEMEAELSMNGKSIKRSGYKHAIHTTVGNASGPQGVEAMSLSEAFSGVLEQMLLNFLKDLQQIGELSEFIEPKPSAHRPFASNNPFSTRIAPARSSSLTSHSAIVAGGMRR